MIRPILMTLAALTLSAEDAAGAQTTMIHAPAVPAQAKPNDVFVSKVCVLPLYGLDTITVHQPGAQDIQINVDEASDCNPTDDWTWELLVSSPPGEGYQDAVEEKSCPALRVQMDKLQKSKPSQVEEPVDAVHIGVGYFFFTNRSGLFQVGGDKARKVVAHWVQETLFEVRSCWNRSRENHTRYVVDRLYSGLPAEPH